MPSFILRHIDPELWDAFRSRCAAEGLTPKQVLLRLIAQYAKGDRP